MPELPEVETIKNQLNAKIKGKRIKEVEVLDPQALNLSPIKFQKKLQGALIKEINRRAKLLIIELNNDWSILIHLKLTGQLIFQPTDERFKRVVFYFTDGTKLAFRDFRRFGFIKLIPTNQIEDYFKKEQYGPEPLEENFTFEVFKNLLLSKPNSKIKPLLMDQTFIAGVGNIYSDEALFYARIHPLRKVSSLKEEEIKNLYQGLREILKKAISKRGSSVDSYVDLEGKEGGFVPFLKVYRREGKKCFRCGAKIERIKLAGRSAHFCPGCQK